MTCIYTLDAYKREVQVRDMYCYADDGFGTLWEAAGSYYDDKPNAQLLHPQMMRMNYKFVVSDAWNKSNH